MGHRINNLPFLITAIEGALMNNQQDATEIPPPASPGRDIPPRAATFFSGAWPLAVLLLLAMLPYAGMLRNDFAYAYDDKDLILDNPYVHSVRHLREVLTTTLFSNLGTPGGLPYYRPMAKVVFLLGYLLFGPSSFGFHLVSLLLNTAVVGILFLLAEELLKDRVAAFAAAVLFALHPIHVEAVAWISAVTDIEVTFFCLLTFWLFLRSAAPEGGRKPWILAVMTGSFVLAILSKEQAVTIPLLASIYEHFYREDRRETTRWQKLLRYGPLWLVSVSYVFLRVQLMGSFAHAPKVYPINAQETLLSALALAGQYVGMLMWPARLSAFHPFHVSHSLLEIPVVAGGCALGGWAYLFYALWKRARPVSFGILWLFVTLVPVLNARWMNTYVLGERFLYLPSAGFCLIAGWACAEVWKSPLSRQASVRTAVVATACALTALCILRINLRVLDWQDDVTLFNQALAAEPHDFRLHYMLGSAYWIRGNSGGAEREWQETLRLEPNSMGPLNSLGALYAQQRRFDQAIPFLEQALRLNPNDADAHLNLGAIYAETGKLDHAEEQFRAAVLLSPMNFNAHNVLGKLYFDSSRLAEAEQQFRQSLQCEPNLAAYDHLGYIYVRRGDAVRAEEAFKAALGLMSTDSHAHFNLGLIYAATGRNSQAMEEIQAALAADPRNPEILSALDKLRH